VNKDKRKRGKVKIALVGKYTGLKDSYMSHIRALDHSSAEVGTNIQIEWIEAGDIERRKVIRKLKNTNGIIIPGGFGKRGSEGKIKAVSIARENSIPFLGICFGFQLAAIEFGRNVLGFKDANSSELDPKTTHPVVDLLPEQLDISDMGGTMRLGAQPININKDSFAHEIYQSTRISERHRHRYEINPEFIQQFEDAGLIFSGRSPDKIRMEIAELKGHPYFLASQFHPEFKSRPTRPAPLYYGLVKAAVVHSKKQK
jgi:CTP synthase